MFLNKYILTYIDGDPTILGTAQMIATLMCGYLSLRWEGRDIGGGGAPGALGPHLAGDAAPQLAVLREHRARPERHVEPDVRGLRPRLRLHASWLRHLHGLRTGPIRHRRLPPRVVARWRSGGEGARRKTVLACLLASS